MALSRGSKIFLVGLVLFFGAGGAGLYYAYDQLGGAEDDVIAGQPVTVEIPEGANAGDVGGLLEEHGVVKNGTAFRLRVRSRGLDNRIQAGSFELETGMSVDAAIDALLAARQRDAYRFRVEEGLTVEQILGRLADQTPYAADEFQAVLDRTVAGGEDALELPEWVPALDTFGPEVRSPFEGLLFPETYEVFESASPRDILQIMVDQLVNVLDDIPEDEREALEADERTLYDLLVVASLVERETRVDDERPTVAGVIDNRLEEGMLLQIDATVLYALGVQKPQVLDADLEVESPYNTYKNASLPPTPISNFGAASLRAALAPDDVAFRYYVLTPDCDGTHAFAETLDEHNRNVAAFREAGRCQEQ